MTLLRKSNIELLRIVAMWMIVFYHLHIHIIHPVGGFMLAAEMPLHVAVVCFVLISGWFGIRFSARGFAKLISAVLFYSLVSLAVVGCYWVLTGASERVSLRHVADRVLCISRSDLWFVRAYVMLYIAAPFVNFIFDRGGLRMRLLLLVSLLFMSVYVGMMNVDPTLANGKNIVNFLFLYTLGRCLSVWEVHKLVSSGWWLAAYCALFTVLMTLFVMMEDIALSQLVWRVAFPYNSVLLIAGAVFLLFFFASLDISSRAVNYVASSTFAVYLLHEGLIGNTIVYPAILSQNIDAGTAAGYATLFAISLAIFAAAIVVDKVTLPLQRLLTRLLTLGCDRVINLALAHPSLSNDK